MIDIKINGSNKPPIDEVSIISFVVLAIILIIVLINGGLWNENGTTEKHSTGIIG